MNDDQITTTLLLLIWVITLFRSWAGLVIIIAYIYARRRNVFIRETENK